MLMLAGLFGSVASPSLFSWSYSAIVVKHAKVTVVMSGTAADSTPRPDVFFRIRICGSSSLASLLAVCSSKWEREVEWFWSGNHWALFLLLNQQVCIHTYWSISILLVCRPCKSMPCQDWVISQILIEIAILESWITIIACFSHYANWPIQSKRCLVTLTGQSNHSENM